jgi:hypothetical protein
MDRRKLATATLLALLASTTSAERGSNGPCDILGAAGNPCVAAHSTVRALYSGYQGPLYRVQRSISSNCSGGEYMKGMDWRGDNDQTQIGVQSIEECCAACAAETGCNHFSLTYSSMQCYLKGGNRTLVVNNGSTAGYCTKGPIEATNISVLEAGGFANIAAHEKFCPAGDCVIATVFDQSPQRNHLGQRISDGVVHNMVNASQHKISVGDDGVNVFGMWFGPGDGYHVDFTNGIAKGNDPESIFAVMSGTHYNDKCCFDYGNSENTATADGDYNSGAMEAIYFGNAHWKGNTAFGSGPWVGADLEAGMYYGGGNATIVNNASQPLTSDFVSLHLKGLTDGFVLKGGDATVGRLATMYSGPRPDPKLACCVTKKDTYQPMRKRGAIILGTGGDNSNLGEGTFYEGYMATGVSSAATDDAIQKNIIAVGYRTLPQQGPAQL